MEFLVSDPVSVEAPTLIDLSTETKRRYVTDLFEDGRVTVRQWPLVARDDWGTETRPRPTFVRRGGTYYQVRVADERILDRERWLFAFERRDEPPADDEVVATAPFDSVSGTDRRIVEAALDAIYAGNDGFLGEPEFDELPGVEYHQDLPAGESDLVPSPPFDVVEYEDEYFRPVTDQRVVAVPEWTFSIDPVAESRAELDAHARETVPDARLAGSRLSGDAREVLETAIEENRHLEDAPLSDGLSEVLDELGIRDDLRPLDAYEERTAFRGAVASYEEEWYRFDLLCDP